VDDAQVVAGGYLDIRALWIVRGRACRQKNVTLGAPLCGHTGNLLTLARCQSAYSGEVDAPTRICIQ
jgi:hypothetical protein